MLRISRTSVLGVVSAATILLAACGGGGGGGGGNGNTNNDTDSGSNYDGTTSAASFSDETTAEEVARAAGEGARKARAQDSAPTLTGVSVSEGGGAEEWHDFLRRESREIVDQASGTEVVGGATTVFDGRCGGDAGGALCGERAASEAGQEEREGGQEDADEQVSVHRMVMS